MIKPNALLKAGFFRGYMKRKFASILALVLVLCCMSSCNRNKAAKPDGTLPDYDQKADELSISIGGWLVPSDLTEEQYVYMKESGIDTFYFAQAGDPAYYIDVNSITEQDQAVLLKMEEYGLNAILHVGAKTNDRLVNIANAAPYNAVTGICYDEPDKEQINQITTCLDIVNQNPGNKTLFVNLYPSGSYKRSGFYTYKSYLRYFCENILANLTVGEKWLSADRYPLTFDKKGNKILDSKWLCDMEALATVRKDYPDVKTNFFIQTIPYGGEVYPAGAEGSRDRIPTYEDVRMQEYTALAFGFDRISCFCYGTPCVYSEFTEEQVGMIDRDGNRTSIYYATAKANNEIKAFDHVLKQFEWQGVFTNDGGKRTDTKRLTTRKIFAKLKNRTPINKIGGLDKVYSTQDTLFGHFLDFESNAGYMVVNLNDTSLNLTDQVTMTFEQDYGYKKALCYIGGQKQILEIVNNALTLDLGVGEGVFVIPY